MTAAAAANPLATLKGLVRLLTAQLSAGAPAAGRRQLAVLACYDECTYALVGRALEERAAALARGGRGSGDAAGAAAAAAAAGALHRLAADVQAAAVAGGGGNLAARVYVAR